jgi:Phytanoyl-CoA dioxygenase (PhyH)
MLVSWYSKPTCETRLVLVPASGNIYILRKQWLTVTAARCVPAHTILSDCAMSEDGRDSDSSRGSGSGIDAEVGLSAATLALLVSMGLRKDTSISVAGAQQVEGRPCASLQPNGDPERTSDMRRELQVTHDPTMAAHVLQRDGVVRLSNILSASLCDRCTDDINQDLRDAHEEGKDHYSEETQNNFGNVDSSSHRWDMYLTNKGAYSESMSSMLGQSSTPLSIVCNDLFEGEDAAVYEFAALISDLDAQSQRVHADVTFQPKCVVYTVFIAMQDVTREMGPTLFIQGSHTDEAHRSLRHNREEFLGASIYHQALLNQGDVVIMDARILHCGGERSPCHVTYVSCRLSRATRYNACYLPRVVWDDYMAL